MKTINKRNKHIDRNIIKEIIMLLLNGVRHGKIDLRIVVVLLSSYFVCSNSIITYSQGINYYFFAQQNKPLYNREA